MLKLIQDYERLTSRGNIHDGRTRKESCITSIVSTVSVRNKNQTIQIIWVTNSNKLIAQQEKDLITSAINQFTADTINCIRWKLTTANDPNFKVKITPLQDGKYVFAK